MYDIILNRSILQKVAHLQIIQLKLAKNLEKVILILKVTDF